jgi:hypothetical protein
MRLVGAAAMSFLVSLGPAHSSCDLSEFNETARRQLSLIGENAIFSIKQDRVALIVPSDSELSAVDAAGVALLELRDDAVVEVGNTELAGGNALASRFALILNIVDDPEAELVVSADQAVLLGGRDCIGIDVRASRVSSLIYSLDDDEIQTHFSAGQVYHALLGGRSLRDGLLAEVEIDLRRNEKLSGLSPRPSDIQSSYVIRPILGRLSRNTVHIPTYELRAPSDRWLSDEIRYTSSIENAEWKLGAATTEFRLSYNDHAPVKAGAYIPLTDYWSVELGADLRNGTLESLSFERAFILRDAGVYGSILFGRFGSASEGFAFSAGYDLGSFQVGGLLGVDGDTVSWAAILDRSIGNRTNVWSTIEYQGGNVGAEIGAAHKLSSGTEVEVGLRRDGIERNIQLTAELSFYWSAGSLTKASFATHERTSHARVLYRNAEVIRNAGRRAIEVAWPEILE